MLSAPTRSGLGGYVRAARAVTLLQAPEELELIGRAQAGDAQAMDRLVRAFAPLVLKHALRVSRQFASPAEDLVQDGMLGLVEAVRHFDPARNSRFSTCALFWIRAFALRDVLENWRLVRVGSTQAQREVFFNLQRERRSGELSGEPLPPSVLAARMHLPEAQLRCLEQHLRSPEVPLDQLAPGGSVLELPAHDADRPDRLAERHELSGLLSELVSTFRQSLPARERTILARRWMASEPDSLQELGARLGLSGERVRQLEARLLERFLRGARAALADAPPRACA